MLPPTGVHGSTQVTGSAEGLPDGRRHSPAQAADGSTGGSLQERGENIFVSREDVLLCGCNVLAVLIFGLSIISMGPLNLTKFHCHFVSNLSGFK